MGIFELRYAYRIYTYKKRNHWKIQILPSIDYGLRVTKILPDLTSHVEYLGSCKCLPVAVQMMMPIDTILILYQLPPPLRTCALEFSSHTWPLHVIKMQLILVYNPFAIRDYVQWKPTCKTCLDRTWSMHLFQPSWPSWGEGSVDAVELFWVGHGHNNLISVPLINATFSQPTAEPSSFHAVPSLHTTLILKCTLFYKKQES